MTPSDERSLAHAQAVLARGAALPPGALPPVDILDSWVRCTRAQLDFSARPPARVVDSTELTWRRQRHDAVRRLALAEIETLIQQIAGSNFLLAFADPDGVVLDLCADNRFRLNDADAAIVAGSCWSEAVCGTNGFGTALATGRAVSVNGLEHFFSRHANLSCAAAPIRDAQGDIVGVLDASSHVASRQQHTQALVRMAATHVENLLLAQQMRGHLVLAVHPRAEFLATLSCGLLAFDADGRVSAMNACAAGLLSGLDLARGTPFNALFDETFERFVARISTGGDRRDVGDVRLRDVLGSALVARCVQAPRFGDAAFSATAHASQHSGQNSSWRSEADAPRERHPPSPFSSSSSPSSISTPATVTASPRPTPSASSAPAAPRMVADDAGVAQTLLMVEAAVRLRVPILILGETGTGKELLARHAHVSGARSGAFVAVNCGALPADLFEAELFGYAGGAFTGARREGSRGLIESAAGGTLLLDEIGELSLPMQAGLLRFLDDQQVRAVGSVGSRRVELQLLAATHVDLEAEVAARRFRADLWHRLNVVQVRLPALRERSDFAAVARSVLAGIDASARLADDALARLARHAWRGNMRELRAVLTRALLLHPSGRLAGVDIERVLPPPAYAPCESQSALQLSAMQRVLAEFERTHQSVSQTSRNLDISRTTVYRYLREGAARAK